jgi:hypothetical protein
MEKQDNPAVTSKDMSPEERLDALADVFAEAFVYLGQRGLLPLTDDPAPATSEQPPKKKKRNVLKST